MLTNSRVWTFVIALLLIVSMVNVPLCAKKSKKYSPEKRIHMFMIALDSGIIEKSDISELKRLTKSQDQAIKSRAIGLLAQYEGEGSGNLIKALTILTPYVLEKKEADAFKRKLIGAKDNDEFLNVIPHAGKWKFQEPELCVSMARILAAGGKYSEALAGFDRIGRKKEGVPRIVAAEGVGDMQFSLKRWEQCIGSYQFALKSIGYLKKLYKYEEMQDDPIIPALTSRIQRKLNEARRKWDEERYGPGFVAYRTARQNEFRRNYLTAVINYKRISERFPDTVYADAAGLYGPKCLFKLALPRHKDTIRNSIEKLHQKIVENKKFLKKYSKRMTIKVRERKKHQIAVDGAFLDELKLVPTGKKAEDKAIAELEKFIKQPEKLYRLEAMQVLGDYFLEEKVDVESAYNYYGQCYKYLEKIKELNKKLQGLSAESWAVPSKATTITQGPKSEKKLVGWTKWIEKNPIKPEQIINRQHCKWYLDSIKARTGKMLSLCFFIKGDREQALKAAKFIVDFDPLEKKMFDQKEPNSYSRLIEDYERGWLWCPEDEVALFGKDKLFIAVNLADFYYEIEDMDKCICIRDNIVKGKYGKLNNNQQSSAVYRLAEAFFRKGSWDKAIPLLEEAATQKQGYSSAQVYIGLGNIYTQRNTHKKYRDKYTSRIIECYENAVSYSRDRETKDQALYFLGSAYLENGKSKKALEMFKRIIRENPKSPWKELCNEDIKKIEAM